MSKIKIKIQEGGCGCGPAAPEPAMSAPGHSKQMPNAHNGEEARMHRTTLAHLMADVTVLLDMIEDGDDLPEWLETKITKAGDYMSSAARYIAGNVARDHGQLEEQNLIGVHPDHICEVDMYHNLYEAVQDAITEDGEDACPQCLYEMLSDAACDCSDLVTEAKYRGRKVKLNKPTRGDVKKFKVYVKDPKTGNVKKVNFGHGGSSAKKKGEKTMKIRKSNKKARKSFRARHNCKNPGPKTKARYWSCRKW